MYMSNFINKYSLGIVCDLTAYSLVNEIRKIELEEPFFQFKNISELRKMDYKSNVWPICLSLMRDDNFTNEIKSFTYFQTRSTVRFIQ